MPLLIPPPNGVTVRMYRIGHGDCFLLAFPRSGGGDPVYVLIDCGQKPGSEDYIPTSGIKQIVDHLHESTGGALDLAIITHEHQDHVNGIWKKTNPYFKDFTIKEAWFAWTENPSDDLANDLRRDHKDVLLNLVRARNELAVALGADDHSVIRLDTLLSLEIGADLGAGSPEALLAAAGKPENSINKQGMKLIKDKARAHAEPKYLSPGGKIQSVAGTDGVRAFVLGPPRRRGLISDEDPREDEAFPLEGPHGLSFGAALGPATGVSPFEPDHSLDREEAMAEPFFSTHYGSGAESSQEDETECDSHAPWRRIEKDWLLTAEYLAIALNKGINNTSLVLAFELPRSRKVLFFPGDAQRGSWVSWPKCEWDDSDVTARDLLSRTVLYKVGHHGSHNATLDGPPDSEHPNLSWMATGQQASEFTAMITAVAKWAEEKTENWVHPLPSIKTALLQKASGRVFQTDTDTLVRPNDVPEAEWQDFLARTAANDLYFDYTILDE